MFRVTGSKIAVIPIEDSPKIGLIHVPETSRQRTDQGIVAFIGPDARDFHPGQYVIFSGHSGTVVYIQDPTKPEAPAKKYILLEERFVFGEIIDFEDCFIPGVYFKGIDGTYIEATYDITMDFIAEAIRSAEWRKFNPVTGKGIDVVTQPPKQEELNVK